MKSTLTPASARRFLDKRNDLELLRFFYCYQIGSTFVHLGLMEDAIIQSMSICDRVKLVNILGTDAPTWLQLTQKTSTLRSSTLGNLINILSRHSVRGEDLIYLKWVKAKRDFFVHRLFHQSDLPGDMDEDEIQICHRKLLYLELIFDRAAQRIWRIIARANLMTLVDLGSSGALMMNIDSFGDLSSNSSET